MYEIGRLCVKLAGRDSRKKCVIVDNLDNGFVLVDGQTRRRKCNLIHLEPLDKILKIKKGASHTEVVKALKAEKIEVVDSKPKKSSAKPKKTDKSSNKDAKKQPKENKKVEEKSEIDKK